MIMFENTDVTGKSKYHKTIINTGSINYNNLK